MREDARLRAWITCSLVLLGQGLIVSGARAAGGDDEQARANAIFQEARKAYIAGDYVAACPKYEEVVRLRPGLGARLGLGDCYRKMGKLALAWETYRGIAEDAPGLAEKATTWADKTTAKKRGDESLARMTEIEPNLGWLTIALPEPTAALPGLVVHLDGVSLERARFGVKLPAERGEHVIDASAPGKKPWEKSVALGGGAELTVGISILEDDVPPKPEVKPPPDVPMKNPPEGPIKVPPPDGANKNPPDGNGGNMKIPPDGGPIVAPKDDFFSTQRILGLSLGIAGVGAAGIGAYFGYDTLQKRDQATATGQCDGNFCDGEGYRLRQASYDAGTVSTGLFVAGGVAFAAGLTLFLTAPRKPRSSLSFVVGPSAILVNGRF